MIVQPFIGAAGSRNRSEDHRVALFAELVANRYLPYIQISKRSWQTDERVLRIHILPALGYLRLDEITAEPIAVLVSQMLLKGYARGTTNRVVIVLRHIFNLAKRWHVPGISNNPTDGIRLYPDVVQQRVLSIEEAQRLMAALREDENVIAAQAIMLLLLTGARRNEVTFAKWEDLDFHAKTLRVPMSKSGRPRFIALNQPALDLLKSIARGSSPFIFPSAVTGRPSSSLHFPWSRIRKRAGLPNLRLHDLRHSFASFLVSRGVSLYIVQNLLGHAHARATQRYASVAMDSLLQAAGILSDVIAAPSNLDSAALETRAL